MASAAPVVTPAPASHFRNLMDEMRTHYASGTRQPFALLQSPHMQMMTLAPRMFDVGDDGSNPEDDATLSQIQADAKASQQASNDTQKTQAESATTQLQSDNDSNSFAAKMAAQKTAAIAASTKTISDAYDKATQLGEKNPAMQNTIVTTMQTVSNVLQSVVGAITDFIGTLIGKVMDIINKILTAPLQFIENNFSSIGGLLGAL